MEVGEPVGGILARRPQGKNLEGYEEYLADFPDAPDVYGMRRKGLRGRILARIVLFTFSAGIDFGFKRNRSRLSDVQEVADLAFINPATG